MKLGQAMNPPAEANNIERVISRIRNAPQGIDIVQTLQREGVSNEIIYLAFKAANILIGAEDEFNLSKEFAEADTDPPPAPYSYPLRRF